MQRGAVTAIPFSCRLGLSPTPVSEANTTAAVGLPLRAGQTVDGGVGGRVAPTRTNASVRLDAWTRPILRIRGAAPSDVSVDALRLSIPRTEVTRA